jgi:hypothetical protein
MNHSFFSFELQYELGHPSDLRLDPAACEWVSDRPDTSAKRGLWFQPQRCQLIVQHLADALSLLSLSNRRAISAPASTIQKTAPSLKATSNKKLDGWVSDQPDGYYYVSLHLH